MRQILVIEDDPDIRELLRYNLSREGFEVRTVGNGLDGVEDALKDPPDLVVLDLMLPKLSGTEVCKKLRESSRTKHVPIIMLTAKGEESDIVFGLGIGADDYIVKPFSVKELIARIYTRFRSNERPTRDLTDICSYGGVEVDRARFEVRVLGQHIPMTLAEFRLFDALIARPGVVMTREILLDAITGGEGVVIDRNIDVHVRSIRKKLGEENRDLIQTVRGVGYKFKEL